MKVAGATVVVTGASRGIGAATARALARAGARVAMVARSADLGDLAAAVAAEGGQVHAYRADLADMAEVGAVAGRIAAELGTPDVLVNNAGAGRFLSVEETLPGEAVAMMAVPYFAAFEMTRAFLPGMLARGSGHVINLTSPASRLVWPGANAYTAARWAMRGFSEALRADLAGTGIDVTLVVPGKVASRYFEANPGSEERIPRISSLIPTLSPEAVAAAIVGVIERPRREVVLPAMLRLLFLVHHVAPWPVEALMVRTGWRR